MQSLRELYKIGRGPSSSHTMGPERAIKSFKKSYPAADFFKVTLFGSLALTGSGHGTDRIIKETFEPINCDIVFDKVSPCNIHPNTMDIEAYENGKLLGKKRVYSVGGGTIVFEGEKNPDTEIMHREVYPLNTFTEISEYCAHKNIRIWEYVEECEGKEIWEYLSKIWQQMKESIRQ
ncbi:MAG: serine dehydratase, partial [Clostridia bacterium]|nr:serine dehydratase [Clostridia bacterium]